MEITGLRLNFIRMSAGDFPFFARLVTNYSVMKYITGRALNSEEAELRFRKALHVNSLNPDAGYFVVFRKEDNEFIGVVKLVNFEPSVMEVGYMLLPEYWGKGFASEMLRYVVEFARLKYPGVELTGIVDPENPASIRVLEKFGFYLYKTGRIDDQDAAFYKLNL